jgi:hypothetical protein
MKKGAADFTKAPEFASIEAFVTYLLDDDRAKATTEELTALSARQKRTTLAVLKDLQACGVGIEPRQPERHVRGYTTSSHDRWFGPGARQ